jgi:lipoyl(octanoyl) transferase
MSTLSVAHLGDVSYRDALALQEGMVRARIEGRTGDWLLYPDHPPVLTVGRGGSGESLRADPETLRRLGIEIFEVARGGDFTWHGPGQLVGYAICDLTARDRDLHRFLRDLEQGLIAALKGWGLEGETIAGRTGVWVGGEKIASIGVAVRGWVSYHGFALNVAPDLTFFDLIHPCGLRGIHMTSLALKSPTPAPTMAEAREAVAFHLARQMGYAGLTWAAADEAHRLAATSRNDTTEIAGAAR